MKTRNRFLAFVLAGVMVLSVAACGQNDNEVTQGTPQTGSASTEDASTENVSTEEVNELAWLNPGQVPIVSEGTEKTFEISVLNDATAGDPETVWMYDYVTQALNINLDVTRFTWDNASEYITLAFAGGELPDIIFGANLSTSDLVRYGSDEGQLIDLAPYINETLTPNIYQIFTENPDIRAQYTDAEGHIWSLGFLGQTTKDEFVNKAYYNYDLFQELNIEIPTTLDEFLEAMRTIKAAYPDMYPIGGCYQGTNPLMFILNAFGYLANTSSGNSIGLRNDEVVLVSADREAFGEYLKFMNTCYEEELIHPDFYTMEGSTADALMAEGKFAFWTGIPTYVTDNWKAWWGAVPLTSDWNDTTQWPANPGAAVGVGKVVVTSACEDPELAVAFLDHWFTYENYRISTVGPMTEKHADYLYGRGGRVLEDTSYYFADMKEDPDQWATNAEYVYGELQLWGYSTIGSYFYDESCGELAYGPMAREAAFEALGDKSNYMSGARTDFESGFYQGLAALHPTLLEYVTTDIYPSYVYLPADVATNAYNTLVAIAEYTRQECANFITGVRDLQELDDYFDEVERLGALDYVELYKEYYEKVTSAE